MPNETKPASQSSTNRRNAQAQQRQKSIKLFEEDKTRLEINEIMLERARDIALDEYAHARTMKKLILDELRPWQP